MRIAIMGNNSSFENHIKQILHKSWIDCVPVTVTANELPDYANIFDGIILNVSFDIVKTLTPFFPKDLSVIICNTPNVSDFQPILFNTNVSNKHVSINTPEIILLDIITQCQSIISPSSVIIKTHRTNNTNLSLPSSSIILHNEKPYHKIELNDLINMLTIDTIANISGNDMYMLLQSYYNNNVLMNIHYDNTISYSLSNMYSSYIINVYIYDIENGCRVIMTCNWEYTYSLFVANKLIDSVKL